MARPKPSKSIKARGSALVEALAAALIVGTCVAAMASTLYFSQGATNRAVDVGVAYNIARMTLEGIKQTGFANTAEEIGRAHV